MGLVLSSPSLNVRSRHVPLACPSCGRTIAIQDVKPGRFRVPCPLCGRPFLLRVGDGPDHEMTASPIGPDVEDKVTQAEPAPTPSDPWEDARAILRRIGSAFRERMGWAWRILTSRGSLVGGTLILRDLGRTSRGQVAKGRQVLLGRDVIVRTMPPDWGGADPISRAAAHREALVAGEITHPNLIRRLDLGEERGRRFVIEEDLTGPTLCVVATRTDWPGGDSAIALILHAARGLLAAHEQGLAHGDPSPDQIWLDAGGVVKLAGLGLGDRPPETRDGREPFTATALSDVHALGQTLETLMGKPKTPIDAATSTAAKLAARMKSAGTSEGFHDLADAIRGMEEALQIPAGATFLPRDVEADRFARAVSQYHDIPLASIRTKLVLGFFGACAAFALLFARVGSFGMAGGVAGLCGLTVVIYSLLRAGLGARTGLFSRTRELVLGGRRADWITLLMLGAVAVGVLAYLGWLAGWIALVIVAAGFAIGFLVAIDTPIARDREIPLGDANTLLTEMRSRGVSEVALREFACKFGGPRWDDLFEALFGLEETRNAREGWARVHPGKFRLDAWRFAALEWLDARLLDRREARDRDRLEPIEESALIARKVNEMTARRKSRRIAEAVIIVGREVRHVSLASLLPVESATIRVTSRPIPDLLREAVETPDHLLSTTWSDDRETERGPNPMLRLLGVATGPRARFLVGGLLLAGFLLWADQAGIINSQEIRARAEQAISDRDVARLRDVSIDLERAKLATEPLVLPGIPPSLTRPIVGYGVGAAGLILVFSAFIPGSRIALFAIPGAAIAWFGPRLGIPTIGPLSSAAMSSAIGAAILILGTYFGRGRR
jgi:hypothetical protein